MSKPRTMALAAETKRITAQFDYSDADVNKGVLEFLKQMSKSHLIARDYPSSPALTRLFYR